MVWSSGAAENFQKGADEFNSRQDKIDFQIEMQTGDYNQYLGAKVASDDLPDMFFLNPYSQVQQFAENDRSEEAFRFLDLMKENSGSNFMDADSTAGFNAFASGEAAMIASGEFSLLNAESVNADLNVGLFGVPNTDDESDAKLDVDVGICIAVNKKSAHLEETQVEAQYYADYTAYMESGNRFLHRTVLTWECIRYARL